MLPFFNLTWHIIAGGIVLLLPGLTWLVWFQDDEHDFLSRLAEAVGLSIATTLLLALVGFLLRWQITATWLVIVYGIFGFSVFTALALRGTGYLDVLGKFFRQPDVVLNRRAVRTLLFLAGFVAILAWRFYQVRELVLPAWVDSLHHVLITRVILERGGLPLTLDPYLPVQFYYHFGFHVITALFSFWSNSPPEGAVLIMGQVLNAGVAFSAYRLGISLWDDWRRAGVAALLVGFVSHMPAYYATWGRYTLLTGLILLPLAMAVGFDLVYKGISRRRFVWLALLTGGVLLSHYFAALLLAIFLIFLGVKVGLQDLKHSRSWIDSRFLPLFGAATTGALMALPWILRVWDFSNRYVRVDMVMSVDSLESLFFPDYLSYLWRMAGPNRNYFLLALGLFGLVIAFLRSGRRSLAWWTLALVVMSAPWGVNLSPFRPDHGVIVLFLPAGLLAADFLFTVSERAQLGFPRLAWISLGAAVLSLLAWGLRDTRTILNPATILATDGDLHAMEWIVDNTPSQARFYINVTPWQYGVYRGVDGGWWIEALTDRETLLPAVMYSLGERDYFEEISSRAEKANQLQGCTPEFHELLQDADLSHVYLVRGRGSLQPEDLEGCVYLRLVYHHQDISIFEVVN